MRHENTMFWQQPMINTSRTKIDYVNKKMLTNIRSLHIYKRFYWRNGFLNEISNNILTIQLLVHWKRVLKMLTLLSEVKFLTARDDINIKDTDYGAFK